LSHRFSGAAYPQPKEDFTAEIAETAEKMQKKQKFKGAEKRYNALKKKEL